MKKNSFFASAVRTILALVAVVMVSLAFTACSKDSDDDSKFTNTATINGKQKSISYAMCKGDSRMFRVILVLEDETRVELVLDREIHLKGNPINLEQKEDKHGRVHWRVEYSAGSDNITASGDPDAGGIPVFETGTLIATNPQSTEFNILLKNGRVKDFDDDSKTHKISVNFSGGAMPKM